MNDRKTDGIRRQTDRRWKMDGTDGQIDIRQTNRQAEIQIVRY